MDIWQNLPPNLRGAVWVLLSAFLFTGMSTLVKLLGGRLPSIEIAFFRNLTGLVFMLPFLLNAGGDTFKTSRPVFHLFRGICGSSAMMCGFYALVHLPLADANAISFARALFLVPMAFFFLSERVGVRRIAATVVGFVGVLMIVRPSGSMEAASVVAVVGAMLVSGAVVCVKILSRTDGPGTLLFYSAVIGLFITTVPAILVWQWPSANDFWLLMAMGLFGVAAQTCFLKAYSVGEVTALAPFDYLRLILAGAVGFFVFADIPDLMTILGAMLIVISTLYITLREARLHAKAGEVEDVIATLGTTDTTQTPVHPPEKQRKPIKSDVSSGSQTDA